MDDSKAIVAALELILTSSARYGVSPADLSSELQQLGLPREHSAAIARIHTDNCPQVTAILTSQSLRRKYEKKIILFFHILKIYIYFYFYFYSENYNIKYSNNNKKLIIK